MASQPTWWIISAALSSAMIVLGSIACLAGFEYGVGLILVLAIVLAGIFWAFHGMGLLRAVEDVHHHVVVHQPRALRLVPTTVAKAMARKERSWQSTVDNYLTALAKGVVGDRCQCCGEEHSMLRRYPFDPHFHARDCKVALGFQQFGNVDLCPWGKLFELPQPVLLGRLSEDSQKGIQYFAYQQAALFGFASPGYFKSVGTEYLRLYATDAPVEHLELLGRKVAAECGINQLLMQG
jgi:hypothetical protein